MNNECFNLGSRLRSNSRNDDFDLTVLQNFYEEKYSIQI